MQKQHPHLGATYKVISLPEGSFVVEVTLPEAPQVNVTGFTTQDAADAWIAQHEQQIATGTVMRAKLHLWK
jgi:hypothetical protein